MFKRFFAAAGAVALLGGLGVLATTGVASAAPTPLQVTFAHSNDGATAGFNSDAEVVLSPGSVTSSTFAQMNVVLSSTGNNIPAAAPTFNTTAYAAGSPRWVIVLSNGATLFSNQNNASSGWLYNVGSGWTCANTTGSPGSGTCTYANAVNGAVGTETGVTVTAAYIVADGDQASGTQDILTDIQYNGQYVEQTPCTVTNPGPQVFVIGKPVSLQISANAGTSSDPSLSYALYGLADEHGLTISSTGLISGTPEALETTDIAHVVVTEAGGDVCDAKFSVEVTQAPAPAPTPSQSSSSTSTTSSNSSSSGSSSQSSTTPTGGVETGGGIAPASPLIPVGIMVLCLGVLALVVTRSLRKPQQEA